jgi:hypothetical protein
MWIKYQGNNLRKDSWGGGGTKRYEKNRCYLEILREIEHIIHCCINWRQEGKGIAILYPYSCIVFSFNLRCSDVSNMYKNLNLFVCICARIICIHIRIHILFNYIYEVNKTHIYMGT